MKTIAVLEAFYKEDYKLEVVFTDSKKSIVDFGPFLISHSHPQYNKYKKPQHFRKFKIENGKVVWGKDWDMIFPISDLYEGRIN